MFVSQLGAVRYALRPFLIFIVMPVNFNLDPISAGASLAGGLLNQAFAKRNLKNQVKAQKELADYNADINKDLYTFQMEEQRNWNEHAEQLGKMAEAGINPLYAEGGFQSAGSANVDGVSVGNAGMPSTNFDFGAAVQAALEQQRIKIEKKNADVNEKSVDSQIRVNMQKVENMISEQELTEEQTKKVGAEIRQIGELMDQKWSEIKLRIQELRLANLRLGLDTAAFQWKKHYDSRSLDIAEKGNKINDFMARTQRLQYGLATQQFEFTKEQWNKQYQMQFAETWNDLENGHFDRVIKWLETNKVKFGDFEATGRQVNLLSGNLVAILKFLTTSSNTMAKYHGNIKKVWQLCKEASSEMQTLENVNLMDMVNKSKGYRFFDDDGKFIQPESSNFLTNP